MRHSYGVRVCGRGLYTLSIDDSGQGKFTCTIKDCKSGYELSNAGECIDINECHINSEAYPDGQCPMIEMGIDAFPEKMNIWDGPRESEYEVVVDSVYGRCINTDGGYTCTHHYDSYAVEFYT